MAMRSTMHGIRLPRLHSYCLHRSLIAVFHSDVQTGATALVREEILPDAYFPPVVYGGHLPPRQALPGMESRV